MKGETIMEKYANGVTVNMKGYKGGSAEIFVSTEIIVCYLKTQVELVREVGPENAVRLQQVTLAGLRNLILADNECRKERRHHHRHNNIQNSDPGTNKCVC